MISNFATCPIHVQSYFWKYYQSIYNTKTEAWKSYAAGSGAIRLRVFFWCNMAGFLATSINDDPICLSHAEQ